MKTTILAAAFALLLSAPLSAGEMETVLAPDSTFFAIEGQDEQPQLELTRRKGEISETLLVPGTDDEAVESDARIVWDNVSSTLFVAWRSAALDSDSIKLATLNAEGLWSEPVTIASGAGFQRMGLQVALSRAAVDDEGTAQATLIHAVWWDVGAELTAEYALVAFEAGQHVSTDVVALDELAGRRGAQGVDAFEDTGVSLHPPLAITRANGGIDAIYGGVNTTRVSRVRIEARRVGGDVRIWKPSGRDGGRTSPARLIADSVSPVKGFISKGRIVLYHPNARFRYVVLENGVWSPERMIQLDEQVTSDKLLRELRRTVDEQAAADGETTVEQR